MSEYTAKVEWRRGRARFLDQRYSREHTWWFDGGLKIPASSSPYVVPVPMSVEMNIDPEEAFVAALSSCHMLWFLSIAAQKKVLIDEYVDRPVGILKKNRAGRLAITQVTLRPRIQFGGDLAPENRTIRKMHAMAHRRCFIANSVKTKVLIDPGDPSSWETRG